MNKFTADESSIVSAKRIVQLDAALLDNALISLFRAQLNQIAKNEEFLDNFLWHGVNISELAKDWLPLAYFLPQVFNGQSPGQKIMNIRLGNHTKLNGLFNFLIGICLPVVLESVTSSGRNLLPYPVSLRTLLNRLEIIVKLADFIHYFYFLIRGGPSRLAERFVRLKVIYDKKPSIGGINFGALTHELLGHSFVQLLILVLPFFRVLHSTIVSKIRKSEKCQRNVNVLNPLFECAECHKTAICAVANCGGEEQKGENLKKCNVYCYLCYVRKFQWENLKPLEISRKNA